MFLVFLECLCGFFLQTKLANKSSADLEKLVCNVTELDQLLTLPPFSTISISDISQMLCGNDTKEIVDVIKELLNIDLLSALVCKEQLRKV